MADFKIKASSYERTPAPVGIHALRAFAIYYIGTQKKVFEGNEKDVQEMVVSFELVGTRHAFNKDKPKEKAPFVVNSTLSASLGPRAKIRKWLKGMNGKDFPKNVKEINLVNEIIDVPCQGQITHSADGQWANIETLLPAAKGKTPELVNDIEVFMWSVEDFDKAKYDKIPGWVQEKIKASKEFDEILASGALAEKTPPKKGSKESASKGKPAPAKKTSKK